MTIRFAKSVRRLVPKTDSRCQWRRPQVDRVDGAPCRRIFTDEDCPIRLGRSFSALQSGYGTVIFQLDLECEVVAIDVEGDIKIIRMQM